VEKTVKIADIHTDVNHMLWLVLHSAAITMEWETVHGMRRDARGIKQGKDMANKLIKPISR